MANEQMLTPAPSAEPSRPSSGFRPFHHPFRTGGQTGGEGVGALTLSCGVSSSGPSVGSQPQTLFQGGAPERHEASVWNEYARSRAAVAPMNAKWQGAPAGMTGSVDAVKHTANLILLEEALRQYRQQQSESMTHGNRIAGVVSTSRNSPDPYMRMVPGGVEQSMAASSLHRHPPPSPPPLLSVCNVCNTGFLTPQILEAHFFFAHQSQNLPSTGPPSPPSRKRAFADASEMLGGQTNPVIRDEASQFAVLKILTDMAQVESGHSFNQLVHHQMLQRQQHQQHAIALQNGMAAANRNRLAGGGGSLSPQSPLSVLLAAEMASGGVFSTPPESPDTTNPPHPHQWQDSVALNRGVAGGGTAALQTALAWEALTRSAINNATLDRTASAPSTIFDRLKNSVFAAEASQPPTPYGFQQHHLNAQMHTGGTPMPFRMPGVQNQNQNQNHPMMGMNAFTLPNRTAPNIPMAKAFEGFSTPQLPSLREIRRTFSDPSTGSPTASSVCSPHPFSSAIPAIPTHGRGAGPPPTVVAAASALLAQYSPALEKIKVQSEAVTRGDVEMGDADLDLSLHL